MTIRWQRRGREWRWRVRGATRRWRPADVLL